jgi:hypothetical protein
VGARERNKTVGWSMMTGSRVQLGGAAGGRGACLSGQEVAARQVAPSVRWQRGRAQRCIVCGGS